MPTGEVGVRFPDSRSHGCVDLSGPRSVATSLTSSGVERRLPALTIHGQARPAPGSRTVHQGERLAPDRMTVKRPGDDFGFRTAVTYHWQGADNAYPPMPAVDFDSRHVRRRSPHGGVHDAPRLLQ